MAKTIRRQKTSPVEVEKKTSKTTIKIDTKVKKETPKKKEFPIIKYNLPFDIIIEILSYVDEREIDYICTFDPRCKNIKNDNVLYEKLMIRRLQRFINPELSTFKKRVVCDISNDLLKTGLKLFSRLDENLRFKWASLYCGHLVSITKSEDTSEEELEEYEYDARHTNFDGLFRFELNCGNIASSVEAALIAVDLNNVDIFKQIMQKMVRFSALYLYRKKHGQENTMNLIQSIPFTFKVPQSLLTPEIRKSMSERFIFLILNILDTVNDKDIQNYRETITYDGHLNRDLTILRQLKKENPEDITPYVFNNNTKNIPEGLLLSVRVTSEDEEDGDEEEIFRSNTALMYGACRDNNSDLLSFLYRNKLFDMASTIICNSLSDWPIIDFALSTKFTVSQYAELLQSNIHPRILQKIAQTASKNLDPEDYIELFEGHKHACECCRDIIPPHIIAILREYISDEVYNKAEEIKEKKRKEEKRRKKEEKEKETKRLIKERQEKEKKMGNMLLGMGCMWKFTNNRERICEIKRAPHSVYFCSTHAKYKGSIKQSEHIEFILENNTTRGNRKFSMEMFAHVEKLKEHYGIEDKPKKASPRSDEGSDEDDAPTYTKGKPSLKKKLPKKHNVEASDSEEDNNLNKSFAKKVMKKAAAKKVKTPKSESESESSEEETPAGTLIPKKITNKKKEVSKKRVPFSDSDSEDRIAAKQEKPKVKAVSKAKKVTTPVLKRKSKAKKEESDSESP